jgi:hypothetical protein
MIHALSKLSSFGRTILRINRCERQLRHTGKRYKGNKLWHRERRQLLRRHHGLIGGVRQGRSCRSCALSPCPDSDRRRLVLLSTPRRRRESCRPAWCRVGRGPREMHGDLRPGVCAVTPRCPCAARVRKLSRNRFSRSRKGTWRVQPFFSAGRLARFDDPTLTAAETKQPRRIHA